MRRVTAVAVGAALVATLGAATNASATSSKNIKRLAQEPIKISRDEPADGSDLAFQKDLLVAGTSDGLGLFRILDRKPFLKQISSYPCPGSQGDVSVWGDLVFYAIDSRNSNSGQAEGCNDTDKSFLKEGVRVIDISNIKKPRQVEFIDTECGSHTQTLVPAGDVVYVYVLSYPIVQEPTCNVASHRKISVVKVPLDDPRKAKVVSTPDVGPAIGCHDVTVFPDKKLAAAACLTEGQIWDISKPAAPEVIAHIYNPFVNIWHSAAITWDGKFVAFGDEFLGSITGTCTGPQQNPIGAMWFYDIKDPESPALRGHYGVPRPHPVPQGADEAAYVKCTTHNFSILPMKDSNRYVAVTGLRSAGLSAVDFSDPANPKEIAFFQAEEKLPDVWAAYWYNGRVYTNDNDSLLGIGAFEIEGLGRDDVRFFDGRLNPQTQLTEFN